MQNMIDNTKLLVRMTTEDRQAINRMIQHKRKEFESVIEKGVVAMLNAQEEHQKLAERRTEYLNILTQHNKQKKEQLQQASHTIKENISQAPMGISAAGQLALTATATVGNALYDNAEQTRQEKEAEQRLFAAQMLYYIPSQDYDKIAKKVANILSYRYQFLIFRLSAGEDGYMRLANFFVHSMKSYAISRLREHKNSIIRALINAAIPPSTDTLNYRDWPSVDIANFRTHLLRLGTHKILMLDEVANQIIKRCGPAIRTLLGGHENYIEPKKGHIETYRPYTLIGALNHTLILNVDGRIHAGILPKHRPNATLDGNVKYPMILLGAGESTADLGVNFATQTTDMVLDSIHIEALKRLVPDFFEHQVIYEIESPLPEENHAADIRYAEERYECPWNPQRENQWHEKLQTMMTAKNPFLNSDEIESFNHSSQQRSMYQAANLYHLKTLLSDYASIYQETYAAIATLFHQNTNIESAKQQVAQKAIYSLYVAQEMIYAMQLTQIDDEKYLNAIRNLINIAHLAIYASREWAFHESFKYHMTCFCLTKIREQLDVIQQAHQTFELAYIMLLEIVEELPYFKNSHKLMIRETQNNYRKIRHFKNQISEQMRELDKIMDTRQSILQYELQTLPPMQTSQEAFEAVMEEINRCQQALFKEPNDYEQALHQISMVLLDIHLLLLLMEEIANKDPRNPVQFTQPINTPLTELRQTHSESLRQFERLKKKPSPLWIRPRIYHQRLLELKQFLAPLVVIQNDLHQTLRSMHYHVQTGYEALDNSIQNFFQRAFVAMQFYFISYFNHNTDHPEDHSDLYQKTKNYYLSFKIENGQHIDPHYHELKKLISTLTSDMNIHQIRKILQQLKKEKDSIELQILDDIEISNIGLNQAQRHHRDAESALIEIQEIQQKVDFIRDNTATLDDFEENSLLAIPSNQEIFEYFEDKLQKMTQSMIQENLLSESEILLLENHFKLEFKKFQNIILESDASEKNWILGIHFFAKSIKDISQIELKRWKDALTLEPIKLNLRHIQSQQPSNLHQRSMTQRKAMQFLIKTYKGMLQLDVQRKNFNPENHLSEIKTWHYIQTTLTWSARLNLKELKWIDKKLSNQSNHTDVNNGEHKSPKRMFFSFILNLVHQHLLNKKRELTRLRKIEHGLNQMRLLPIDLESTPHEDGTSLESFLQKKEKFSKILIAKISSIDKEVDDLMCSRKILIGQTMKRIFLYEWHSKTYENSKYLKCSLFKRSPQTSSSELLDNPADSSDSHYSIETLENWFESFKQKTHLSLSKSESDSIEDESPTIESIEMITPMAKKLLSSSNPLSHTSKRQV